jgi:HEAT repeat protein
MRELDMLDQAFDELKKYDWGVDPKVLKPIDDALVSTHGDADARDELEKRLVAILSTDVSNDAKDFVCRKLMVIGTATSVPALAELLPKKDLSHMARYALERIPAPEAAQAMRDALPKLQPTLKVGVISSLGVRQDEESVSALAELVAGDDNTVARSAAMALGDIRSADAAQALAGAKPSHNLVKIAVTDASLACAESLLADGKKKEALAVYKGFAGTDQPKHVRMAATKGILACAR